MEKRMMEIEKELQALEVIKVSRSEEEFMEYCKTRALTILLENSWNAESEAAFLLSQAIGSKEKIPETELEDKIKRLERKLEKVNGEKYELLEFKKEAENYKIESNNYIKDLQEELRVTRKALTEKRIIEKLEGDL